MVEKGKLKVADGDDRRLSVQYSNASEAYSEGKKSGKYGGPLAGCGSKKNVKIFVGDFWYFLQRCGGCSRILPTTARFMELNISARRKGIGVKELFG